MPLHDANLGHHLQILIESRDAPAQLAIFNISHGQSDYHLRQALQRFGLQNVGYSLHILRNGATVHAFLTGISSHAVMIIIGGPSPSMIEARWATESKFKRYLQTHMSLLIKASTTERAKKSVARRSKQYCNPQEV